MTNYRPYNVYSPRRPERPKKSRRRLSVRQAMWLSLIFIVALAALRVDLAERAHAKAAAQAATARRVAAVAKLDVQIAQIADDNPQLSLSVATSDIARGQVAEYNANNVSDAASTAKVLSAALYLNEVEKGQKNLNQSIGGVSARQSLQLMVQQSDDTQWANINDLLSHSALQAYASGLGLASYNSDTNTLSAADMTKLLSLLYEGDLLNEAHTSLLLSFMQHTNREDFISPAVTASYSFYHKVGLDDDQVNDVGLIAGTDDTLVISIFTNGNSTYDWPARAALMQKITHLAEQAYFN